MKYARIALLAITMAGLGSQMGVGLPLSNGTVKPPASSAPRQVVFVDKAELAKLHPSWQALNTMKATLSRTSKLRGKPIPVGPARSRTELAARAAIKADKALAELQQRKYDALRVRSEAMTAQKMQSAELDWKADVRGIEQTAAAQAKAVDSRYGSDLLNARLKAMAADAASKVAGKDGSGMDQAVAGEVSKSSADHLAAVTGADSLEKKAIADSAAQKIDALKQASAKRIEEEVRDYEREQSKIIEKGIGLARDEVARQMGSDAMVIARARLAEATAASSSGSDSASSASELQAAVAALQVRIDKDVDAAVRDLAASNGMAVVFQRGKSTPNATSKFADFIKKRGWNAYGPAIGGIGSS